MRRGLDLEIEVKSTSKPMKINCNFVWKDRSLMTSIWAESSRRSSLDVGAYWNPCSPNMERKILFVSFHSSSYSVYERSFTNTLFWLAMLLTIYSLINGEKRSFTNTLFWLVMLLTIYSLINGEKRSSVPLITKITAALWRVSEEAVVDLLLIKM